MRSTQFTLHQIFAVLKRRRRFLILPPILVTIICIVGAIYLPRRYESSTTIWVQKDEILNPLVSFTMAVQLASEDRLQTFEEIVYSRSTIEALLDSLHMRLPASNTAAWDELVDKTKANIHTDKNGTNSFTILFVDSDPVRAQRAVQLLADLFIQTRLKAEFRRNEYTVKFFEGKLREYEGEYDQSQQSVLNLLRQRSQEMPGGGTSLTSRFESVTDKIRESSEEVRIFQRALDNLSLFPAALKTDKGRMILAELANTEVPYHADLRALIISYDSVSTRYTSQFPEVLKYENQINFLHDRMGVS
ncbi:MAG: Wzz/FepE/Etk N-terminal domain-containing protein, partial [Bacteroidota bacterium]